MKPSGTIYKKGFLNRNHGEVRLALPFRLRILYNYFYFWGSCFLVAAISGIILFFAPIVSQETTYQLRSNGVIEKPNFDTIALAKAQETSEIQDEASQLGLDSAFSIVIPKIDARAHIIANVDTANEKEYLDALTQGVAHAKGTYFPGQGKPIFLFAHSTNASFNVARYNAVFYLLSKLEKGDRIIIYFSDKRYTYEVSEKQVKAANDTSFLYDATNEEKLYLMTCTPPGTIWKRLFVIAEPMKI